jgi:hypothetical protein
MHMHRHRTLICPEDKATQANSGRSGGLSEAPARTSQNLPIAHHGLDVVPRNEIWMRGHDRCSVANMMRRAVLAAGVLLAAASPAAALSAPATKVSVHHPSCHKNLRAAAAASNPYCPFGVLGVLPPPRRNVAADVSSAPLPDSTRALALVVDYQDPEGEGFFDEYTVMNVKPTDPVENQVDGCLIVGSVFSATPVAFTYSGSSKLVACATLAQRLHTKRAGLCHTVFVPGFANGAAPTRAVIREAQKRMAASVNATCSRPHHTQIGVKLRAPRDQTLNSALGLRAHTASGAFVRLGGRRPSRSSRLVYGWGVASG